MKNYIYAGNEDRIFNEDSDLRNGINLDYEYISARLLGRDAASISKPKTKLIIENILEEEILTGGDNKLIIDIISQKLKEGDDSDIFEATLSLLREFKFGFSGL